jgi:hypothetical protein
MARQGSGRREAVGRFGRFWGWLRGNAVRDSRGDDRRSKRTESSDEIRARTEQWLLYCQSIHRRQV